MVVSYNAFYNYDKKSETEEEFPILPLIDGTYSSVFPTFIDECYDGADVELPIEDIVKFMQGFVKYFSK
jgi:hypothetical protein